MAVTAVSARSAAGTPFRLSVLTGALGGLLGFFIGIRIGLAMGFAGADNAPLFLGYALGAVGYFAGLGFFSPAVRWFRGLDTIAPARQAYLYGEQESAARYFRLTLDHKVIGIQYLALIMAMFCFGGLSALLIRLELFTPNMPFWRPDTYLTLVGLHSATMVFMGTSAIVGPLGNYLVPLMIGAKRMAFPWLEALSYWLLLLAFVVFASTLAYGGFPTGWTGYAPLADQAHQGMDSYLVAFILVGAGLVVSAINMLATIMHMRAPGMSWNRLPIFVWSVIVASLLGWLAAPVIMATDTMVSFDRIFNTGFFIPGLGGSPYLYENLFWTFGHPEVYIFAVPAFGIALELLPVFSRKPLFSYNAAVLGMLGIGLMSWFVWQHHLFVSGLTPSLRPFFMFSTEMISFPTGIVFFNAIGTLYKGRIRFTVPMMFCLALFWNFLLGGFSGVFLSDVPTDVQLHGSYVVQAHFHFVLMGSVVFALFAATYYWFPKFTGRMMNTRLGQVHFWWTWIGFNGTFITLMIVGFMGMPRRVVTYLPDLQTANQIATVFAFILGASIFVFLYNVVYSWGWGSIAPANPWGARTLEWQVPTPVPTDNFSETPVVTGNAYDFGPAEAPAMAVLTPSRYPELRDTLAAAAAAELQRPARLAPMLGRMLILAGSFFFASYFFAFAVLQIFSSNHMWLPAHVTHPAMGLGVASAVLLVLSGLSYLWGQLSAHAGRTAQLSSGIGLALLLALASAVCYAITLSRMGFNTQSGGYASVFFGLTAVYLAVLAALALVMVGFLNRARLGRYAANLAAVDAFGEVWGWFIAVGVAAYLVLYILPFLSIE